MTAQNKTMVCLLLVLFTVGMTVGVAPLRAADVKLGIGFNTWFAGWEPYWLAQKTKMVLEDSHEKAAPGFCYGPTLSLQLPRHVRLATMFQYGVFTTETQGTFFIGTQSPTPTNEKKRIVRYDSDSTLSYFFTKYVGIFAGFKYLQYQYTDTILRLILTTPILILEKKRYRDYCPSIGVTAIIPLKRPILYLILNASALYGYSIISRSMKTYVPFIDGTKSPDIHKIGANGTITLAVYIEQASVTMTAGFRYQMFKLLSRDGTVDQPISKAMEHFYGATMGISYTIDFLRIGKKKDDSQEIPAETE